MRLVNLILKVVIMAGTASTITCQGQYTETYTNTVTRAVGPTTLTGARGTLPVPVPSDANSIWLAPNGDDGDPGTEAQPKLTLAGAIAALGAITNIHIFRNGYVGDLTFNITSDQTLPASNTIQVEEGEIAYVTGSFLNNFIMSTGCVANGIDFTGNVVLQGAGSSVTFENCKFLLMVPGTSGTLVTTFEYCHMTYIINPLTATAWTVNFNNCVIAQVPTVSGTALSAGTGAIKWQTAAGSPANITINMDHTYVLAPYFVEINFGSGSASSYTVTINATDSAFIGVVGLVNGNSSGGVLGKSIDITYTFDYVYGGITSIFTSVLGASSQAYVSEGTITPTITNEIDPSTPSLLRDLNAAATAADVNGSRLQIAGVATLGGTGRYFITSPLYTADSAGGSLNPWDEAVTGPVRAYGSSHTFELAPASHTIEPEFVGNREVNELNGGSDQDFDALRRIWRIEWTPARDALNNDWKRIQALLWDKSRKKVYLRGVNGNFLDGFATQAVFDDTDTLDGAVDGSFALQNLPTPGTISMNWYNFWLEVTSGSTTYEYWISSNDGDDTPGSKLYIVDKLGQGLPANGTYDVAIRYFIASLRLEGQPLRYDPHRPGFLDGQRWSEGYNTGSVTPETDQGRFQGKGFALILVEQTDPKAAPS